MVRGSGLRDVSILGPLEAGWTLPTRNGCVNCQWTPKIAAEAGVCSKRTHTNMLWPPPDADRLGVLSSLMRVCLKTGTFNFSFWMLVALLKEL